MPLAAQRFRGVTTLERCVSEGYRLTLDDPDRVAVTRLQHALQDLGYLGVGAGDGLFGPATGKAVTAFKTDAGLQPTDPVASTGTIGALDQLFAWEPDDPDAPDAGGDGLREVGEAAMGLALSWVGAAEQALARFAAPDLADASPERVAFEAAVVRNFGLADPAHRDTVVRVFAAPMMGGLSRLLGGAATVDPMTRVEYLQVFAPLYEPLTPKAGLSIAVTPPFRNAWDDTERAMAVLRTLARNAYPATWHWAWPGTARYAGLGLQQLRNNVAYAVFAYEVATGMLSTTRWSPVWYPL
jgi:peptidoglycan hydrolase-like protein with peptidoglycan-binding domain